LDYSPCEECGDGMSETLNQSGKVLCEKCHNKINCGCETCVCEECGEVHEADLANESDYREVGK
jgi:hypothetical protein